MKLQNLIIIFLIIIIPIIFVFSLYLNLEAKTITLQTEYDVKLIEATKEAVEAFEINTTQWNNDYSTLANSKRQDLISSINVFTTSLADKLRIGGSSKESVLSYVPAIVYIMYDGYYIYSPTYVPRLCVNNNGVQLFYYKDATTNDTKVVASATQNIGGTIVAGEPMYFVSAGKSATGNYAGNAFTTNIEDADKIYKHVLKTFVPYTSNYTAENGKEYIINYTLDNYVRIYEENGTKADEGYFSAALIWAGVLSGTTNEGDKTTATSNLVEKLTENILVRNSINEDVQIVNYPYVYNSNSDKRYYDEEKKNFFTIDSNYIKVYLPNAEVGSNLAEYKRMLYHVKNSELYKYVEVYQMLNNNKDGNFDKTWYILNDTNNTFEPNTLNDGSYKPFINEDGTDVVPRNSDCTAVNFNTEMFCFYHKLKDVNGMNFTQNDIKNIWNNRINSIINNINNNLNLSISNYSAQSGIEFKLPELSAEDWEQALSNVSMITFFQGMNIGLKTYNNYVIVSSSQNNEFINKESVYYICEGDKYYHRYGGECINSEKIIGAYKNSEFNPINYTYIKKTSEGVKEEKSGYYYKHATIDETGNYIGREECFNCIVNRNNFKIDPNMNYEVLSRYQTTLQRESYMLRQKIKVVR